MIHDFAFRKAPVVLSHSFFYAATRLNKIWTTQTTCQLLVMPSWATQYSHISENFHRTSLFDLALFRVHTGSSLSTSRGLDSTTWMSSISKNLTWWRERSEKWEWQVQPVCQRFRLMLMCLHNAWENIFHPAAEAWLSCKCFKWFLVSFVHFYLI